MRSWRSASIRSSSASLPGIGFNGRCAPTCSRPMRNSCSASCSNSASRRSKASRLDLYSLTSFSSGVAISAIGRMPAMCALPLRVCRARCKASVTGCGSSRAQSARKPTRASRWVSASLVKISSSCGSSSSTSLCASAAACGASANGGAWTPFSWLDGCSAPASGGTPPSSGAGGSGSGSPLARACAVAASRSTSSRWRWALAANSSTSSGNRATAWSTTRCTGSLAAMLRSSTRLNRFSIDQASSPITRARTIRPLPLRVWKARRTSVSASRSSWSAFQAGR